MLLLFAAGEGSRLLHIQHLQYDEPLVKVGQQKYLVSVREQSYLVTIRKQNYLVVLPNKPTVVQSVKVKQKTTATICDL